LVALFPVISQKRGFAMGDRSALNVMLSFLAVGLLLGTTGCNSDSNYTGSGVSASNDSVLPSYSGSTSNTTILSWTPPTERTDDSALTNLAGFRIYYGKSLNVMTRIIDVRNPGQTSQFIDGLDKGTWYFAVTAYTTDGLESDMSALGAKRIL
jgi:hypothetical protein